MTAERELRDFVAAALARGIGREDNRPAGRSDPTTGLAYEYRVIGDRDYELCTVFETESRSETDAWCTFTRNWAHGRGRHCFELTVKGAI